MDADTTLALNETVAAFAGRRTIYELFQLQAELTPERPAVRCKDIELTYRELNTRANKLAVVLRKKGVEANVAVGLCMETSVDMIVGLLGTSKAGGYYVPLAVDNPKSRLTYQLKETGAPVLITHSPVLDRARELNVDVVCVDAPELEIERPDNFANAGAVEDVVYVIYTSGSTGTPKGVIISHASLVTYSTFMCRLLKVEEHPEGLHFATVSTLAADLGNTCIFSALISGGCLHVVERETAMTPALFRRYLSEHAVDVLKITPSHLEALLSNDEGRGALPRKYLVLGGEACTWDLVRKVQHRGSCEIINHYGPTETTVGCCACELDREMIAASNTATVPLGRAIAGNEIYIVDDQLTPTPIGVAGELCVAGKGLAYGYLGRPRETAERFIPNPFSQELSTRLYRTGDLARFLPDGNIEFLGRIDDQLKIRGFRVEPKEIEAALIKHAHIAQAAVTILPDEHGARRLVAYVVPAPGHVLDAGQVKTQLREEVPEFMVPTFVVILPALPLTPNGKLDRKALPLPEVGSHAVCDPIDATERALVTLYGDVLELESVSTEASFFDLGGHSLLAIRLISAVRSTLGAELSIGDIFEFPAIVDLAERVKRAKKARPAPQARPHDGPLPLSFAQERLWFLHRLQGSCSPYKIPVALRLQGALDLAALEAAANDVMARHEILRTVFSDTPEGPRQIIVSPEHLRCVFTVRESSEGELAGMVEEAADYDFNLETEAPMRVSVFRLEDQKHVVLLLLHHIAVDAWSLVPLARDLSTAYAARLKGEPPEWQPLPVQYADYARWQRNLLGDELDPASPMATQLTYWREALAGLPEEIEVPKDRARPPVSSYRGERLWFEISPGLHRKLLNLARAADSTLFMVLQASIAALLTRLGAGEDIVLGTPVAGRMDLALDDVVGFFVNTLVLRTNTSANPSFLELVRRVKEQSLRAYANQEFPFERLVDILNPQRSLARHPLFQINIALQSNPEPTFDLQGLHCSQEAIGIRAAKFDMTFDFRERRADGKPQGLDGIVEYASDLFDKATISAMAARLLRLLERVAEHPSTALASIDILSDEEQTKALKLWNDTAKTLPAATLTDLFEMQVAQTSDDEIAAESDGYKLTYRDLNRRANQLAHYLRKRGVRAETRVGICIGRNTELLVAVLATLKAGGAYVPLDPEYPPERLRFMVEDSGLKVLLRLKSTGAALATEGIEEFALDNAWEKVSHEAVDNPGVHVDPDNAAYVIYTSGSTGKPKGVICTHGGLANYLLWARERYDVGKLGAPVHSSVSFDLTISALFLPLISGGRVILLRNEKGIEDLTKVLSGSSGFDLVKLTPSHLDALSSGLDAGRNMVPVRVLVVGGESLSYEQLAFWRRSSPSTRVINEYGPTETVVGCVTFEVDAQQAESGNVPIGVPITNTQVYVLDAELQIVPIGVAGELYIGGAGVARGYLNRPDLTAERFVPNPFSDAPGARLYRTGDLVKWRANGIVEYLGRLDDQIKLRGFRIEPGEIEAVLREHNSVSRAVVIARQDRAGDQRLVAYVVTNSGQELDSDDLRAFLKDKLPAHMIPSAFVQLPELPVTSGGKLDRRLLPALAEPERKSAHISPRSAIEESVARIFCQALGISRISVEDDFFSLGGHSLLLIRVIALIRDQFGLEIPLRVIFERPTVSAVARILSGTFGTNTVSASAIHTVSRKTTLPLSPGEEMLWLLGQLSPTYFGLHGSLAKRITGPLNLRALEQAINEVVQRHEVLRTSFAAKGIRKYLLKLLVHYARSMTSKAEAEKMNNSIPHRKQSARHSKFAVAIQNALSRMVWALVGHPVRLIASSMPIDVPVVNVDVVSGDIETEVARLAGEEVGKFFDLEKGPLLRVKLFRLSQWEHVFVLTLHHIVCDAWSMGILAWELGHSYQGYSTGTNPELPQLAIQYADYAAWRRAQVAGNAFQKTVNYWKKRLEGLPQLLPLPTDGPASAAPSLPSDIVTFRISPQQTQQLKSLSCDEGATIFMILLAVYQLLLYRLSGLDDIAVAVTTAERGRSELESLIGFFVGFVVVRTDLSSNPSFSELLQRVRKTCVDAYANAEPSAIVEALVQKIGVQEYARLRGSTFKAVFTWISVPTSEIDFAGMTVESFALPQQEAELGPDVVLQGRERDGGIDFRCIYKKPLFSQARMKAFAKQFESLAWQVITTPQQTINTYSLTAD